MLLTNAIWLIPPGKAYDKRLLVKIKGIDHLRGEQHNSVQKYCLLLADYDAPAIIVNGSENGYGTLVLIICMVVPNKYGTTKLNNSDYTPKAFRCKDDASLPQGL